MELEDVFSSKTRMTILRLLMRLGQLNVSDIAKRLGLNYVATRGHLRILEDEGILQHRAYGRIRLFRFCENSPKAEAVQGLIETWEKGRT